MLSGLGDPSLAGLADDLSNFTGGNPLFIDELGAAARFSVDEKFRADAYRRMTKISLEHFPWIPVIQPYEDYGLQKYVDFTPNPNQQFELRRFNFKLRRT